MASPAAAAPSAAAQSPRPRSLYAAFDRFPSSKGSATHIDAFARALFAHRGPGILYVLGDHRLPPAQREQDGTTILRQSEPIPNMLQRGLAYSARLERILDETGDSLDIVHVRDPWGGVPALATERRRRSRYKVLYELNGLPSIELPEHRPNIAPQTVGKLDRAERFCLTHADHVVAPSEQLARLARDRGAKRTTVIPNGAHEPDPAAAAEKPVEGDYLLYFGALQPWQGVDTLLRAMASLADTDLALAVCASTHPKQAKELRRLQRRLGLERVVWTHELTRDQLAPYLRHATAVVAPLSDCPRNTIQGCAPLKVVEAMAAAKPVIASDLEPTRELIEDGHDGILVAPDRPAELARAIRLALEDREQLARIGAHAHRTWRERLTWERSIDALHRLYDDMGATTT